MLETNKRGRFTSIGPRRLATPVRSRPGRRPIDVIELRQTASESSSETAAKPAPPPAKLTATPTTPAAPEPRRRNWLVLISNGLGVVFVLLVLFAAYLGGVSRLIESRAQHTLKAQLATTAGAAAFSGKVPAEGQPVAVLKVPSIGLSTLVVEGTSAGDLEKGPGLLEGSAPPGTGGDTVIEGRRKSFGGPFDKVPSLRTGDDISVVSALGSFTYQVSAVTQLAPGSKDPIAADDAGELSLVTSSPSWFPAHVVIVEANLTSTPVAVDAAIPPTAGSLGLAGDPSAAFLTLVAAELLVALGIGAFIVNRRRAAKGGLPLMGWVLLAPVVVALLLLLFSAAAKLLPATL